MQSDRSLHPTVVSAISTIATVARRLRLPYCRVGPIARDVLLGHVFGLHSRRATRDVDIAWALEDWEQF